MSLVMERGAEYQENQCISNTNREMGIYVANTIKEMLDAEIELYKNFEIILGGVEDIDYEEIQMVVEFKQELEEKKRGLMTSSMSHSNAVFRLIDKRYNSGNRVYGNQE